VYQQLFAWKKKFGEIDPRRKIDPIESVKSNRHSFVNNNNNNNNSSNNERN